MGEGEGRGGKGRVQCSALHEGVPPKLIDRKTCLFLRQKCKNSIRV